MITLKKTLIATMLGAIVTTSAYAECAFENDVPVKSLSAGFEAWKAATDAMAECGNFTAELDQEFREKQPAAFAAKPPLYQIGGVANSTIVPLLNEGTIRPLDDLVEKYGQQLTPNQLIRIDGKIMAVAMMVNAQHLMYRQDIFEELGIEEPTNYDEVIAAAEKIQEAGVVEYPMGATLKTGWNLAQDFVNMYRGYGGEFVDENLHATFNNEAGVKALERIKEVTQYLDPEYLVSDSTFVQQQFQQGKIAMANFWASRAGAMDNETESQVVGKIKMAGAPLAEPGAKPVSTLWWDGIVIAKNISDEEAEAAFKVAMEGIDEEMVKANNDLAAWLIQGYEPGRLSEGVAETAAAGTAPYPASTYMGIVQSALGNNLADFLTGKESAEQSLKDAEAEYMTAAREKGLF